MKLYGTPPTRAVRALWLINELEIDCEIVEVDLAIQRKSNWRRVTPQR